MVHVECDERSSRSGWGSPVAGRRAAGRLRQIDYRYERSDEPRQRTGKIDQVIAN